MEVLVNGKQIEMDVDNLDLPSIIKNAMELAISKDKKVITLVKLNDKIIKIEDDTIKNYDKESVNKIEIFSDTPLNIAINGLEEGGNKLNIILDFLANISRLFRQGKEEQVEALKHFANVLEMLGWLMNILKNVEYIIDIKYNTLEIDGKTFEDIFRDINSTLREIQDNQKTGDYGEVADLIEYELIKKLGLLYKIFRKLEKKSKEIVMH